MTARLADTPVLMTERLTLRAPRMADFAVFAAFWASPRARFVGGPGDTRAAWRAFAHTAGMWALKGFGAFVFTRKGSDAPLGMAGPWEPEAWPEREIAWTLWDAASEGHGLACEAAVAGRDYAYDVLGWTTAVSYVDAGNARSVALAERMGARLDPDAAQPDREDPPVLVYRHPDRAELA